MADGKRKYGSISKGMKLTIAVEQVINDVLVVVLEHGSKVFRGVLLDSKKRNLPPGICTAFGDPGGSTEGEADDNSPSSGNIPVSDTPVDVAASVNRHTYNQNISKFGTQFQGPPIFSSMRRPGGGKPTRNIRLRPRQTLCSKCKSTCLDSDNGPIPVNSTKRPTLHQNKLVSGQLQSLPPPDDKYQTSKSVMKPLKRRQTSVFPNDINGPKPTKLIKVTNSTGKLTKTSPFIKISIGDSTVMNIPPRIHEMEKDEISSEEKCNTDLEDNIVSIESHLDEHCDTDDEKKSKHKKALKKMREKKSSVDEKNKDLITVHHKKHKKSRHKSKEFDENDGEVSTNIIITENIDSEDNDDKSENSEPHHIELVRPRLLYTWRHNKGLSPRHEVHQRSSLKPLSPQPENQTTKVGDMTDFQIQEADVQSLDDNQNGSRKEYKLRSRSRSVDSNPEYEITEDSAYVSYEDPKSASDRSEGCSTEVDTSSETDSSDYGDGPPGDENLDAFRPLMMKIHTNSVPKCITSDGRKIHTGDIVWGKIKGFPWWPGRVLSISVSQRDNGVVLRQMAHIAWFGSSTMSHIQCSDLHPFLDDFKLRYKRKKRGPYKTAIKQATIAAQSCGPNSDIDLEEFEVS